MQNIDMSKLISVKFDLSLVQDTLTSTIKDIYSKLSKLETQHNTLSQKSTCLDKQTHKLYQLIQQTNQKYGQSYKQLDDKITSLKKSHGLQATNGNYDIVQKTPKQVLDHIQKRLKLNLNNEGGNKQLDINCNPPNAQHIIQTIRVKGGPRAPVDNKQLLDQKVFKFYQKTVEKIQQELMELRRQFTMQISQIVYNSANCIDGDANGKMVKKPSIDGKNNGKNNATNKNDKNAKNNKVTDKVIQKNKKNVYPNKNTKPKRQKSNGAQFLQFQSLYGQPEEDQNNATQSKNNIQQNEQKQPLGNLIDQQPQPTYKSIQNCSSNMIQDDSLSKQQIRQQLQKMKRQLKQNIQRMMQRNQQKIQQVTRTNSILADHLVQTKKTIEDIVIDKDAIKLQISSIRQKNITSQKQLNLVIQNFNQYKNRLKTVQNNLLKLTQQVKQYKITQSIKQQPNQDENSKKDIFRQSHTSFRSSVAGNLNPIRNNSIIKASNGRLDTLEQNVKTANNKLLALFDRVNRMEDQRRKSELSQFNSSLPKIDKENKSNINPIQIIKKQIKKLNEDLIKTNQKLTTTKDRLNQLYQTHADVPNKIQDIYVKLRQYNQLQQDRLIELIKQLINRALSDPFDNNFTNRLKRQINVKFLEIKHQYNCILKEIQNKVENRAEIGELQKITHKFQEAVIQVKTLVNKKCDTQDFKKGIKYIQGKIKEVFQFAKQETVALANQQKQYIGAKKQSLH